ncbi:hypothetical protein BDV12DRAFT_204723 [Aspergillus spectabilis]
MALSSLERLFVGVSPVRLRDYDGSTNTDTDNAEAMSAVLAVRPLKYLCLRGLREATSLHRILAYHGQTLRGLCLEPYDGHYAGGPAHGSWKHPKLAPNDITLMAKTCPDLQELRLQIRRTEGNSQECDVYRSFGQLAKLRTLILDQHFDPRERGVGPETLRRLQPHLYPEEEEEDHKVDAVLFRTTLINAATDETLALGIWDLVVSSQASRRLQNLRIVPFGLNMYSMNESYYLIFLARSFFVSRCGLENPIVEEVGKMAWTVWQEDTHGPSGPHILPRGADEVIAGLWPALVGREDWSTG